MNGTRTRTAGFTIIELLVVVAIIGVLVGMLLPAVQNAREASRRAACVNNLKQIGLAFHSYATTHGRFPAAFGWNDPAIQASPGFDWYFQQMKAWGWGARILPAMEEQTLADTLGVASREFNDALPGNDPATWPAAELAAIRTPIAGFLCPSDPESDPINTASNFCQPGGPDTAKPARSNYAGVYGYQYSNWWPHLEPKHANHQGLCRGGKGVALKDATDGLSKTMLVGERASTHQAAYWAGVAYVYGEADDSSPKVVGRTFLFKLNCPLLGNDRYYSAFSSLHPGGGNFVFGDGSVRFIQDSIEFNNGLDTSGNPSYWGTPWAALNKATLGVYQKLGCRDDGQPLADF